MDRRFAQILCAAGVLACQVHPDDSVSYPAAETGTTGSSASMTGGGPGTSDSSETGSDDGTLYDVAGAGETGDPSCNGYDGFEPPDVCDKEAPPDSFDPVIQWTWSGPAGFKDSIVAPLVANLTDDNEDGQIDACDTPDVLVVLHNFVSEPGRINVLDGETGAHHFEIPTDVAYTYTPAIGDIDDDGSPEIVGIEPQPGGSRLIAFDHDGTLLWYGEHLVATPWGGAVALADLDNDGDVEIIATDQVTDHEGHTLFTADIGPFAMPTAADLDDDGDLEVIFGREAYHHDGTLLFDVPSIAHGFPQVADLDGDGLPEILLTNVDGLTVLEHDGAIKYTGLQPTGDSAGVLTWRRPAAIHDFDGDGDAEYSMSSANHYTAYHDDATILWSAEVEDISGFATGTAFDFLGDGVAEAMYADENTMWVFDGQGISLMSVPRSSQTLGEYPIVADIDDDASAEIVVVSNGGAQPSVTVIADAMDRWIPTRRIWNQHTYHVTNVLEDGRIPQFEPPHWKHLNTFRTNAQITADGEICNPRPEG